MAIIVEDGTGKADANSYVDSAGAFAADYIAGHLYAAVWTAATTDRREAAVRMASRTLDANFNWRGEFVNDTQALGWPREAVIVDNRDVPSNAVPVPIQQATMELAIALLTRDRTNDQAATAEATKVALGEGAIDLEFSAGTNPASKQVNAIPSSVYALVRKYGNTGSGMARVRRA